MIVLAIDTSSVRTTTAVIVAEDEADAGWLEERDAPNQQGETLAPLIASVLGSAGLGAGDLDAIAVGLGPGPFTGLRVGVVTARAMADALDIPTYGECSLDVIARDYPHLGVRFAVVTDARRKQVYWRCYNESGNPAGAPSISPPSDLADRLDGEVEAIVGAGVQLYPAAFERFLPTRRVGADPIGFPNALTLGQMVIDRARSGAPSEALEPLYLRRPDAKPPGAPKQVTPA